MLLGSALVEPDRSRAGSERQSGRDGLRRLPDESGYYDAVTIKFSVRRAPPRGDRSFTTAGRMILPDKRLRRLFGGRRRRRPFERPDRKPGVSPQVRRPRTVAPLGTDRAAGPPGLALAIDGAGEHFPGELLRRNHDDEVQRRDRRDPLGPAVRSGIPGAGYGAALALDGRGETSSSRGVSTRRPPATTLPSSSTAAATAPCSGDP